MIRRSIDSLRQDLRFAWRGFIRTPGFLAVAVATLGLGIGVNSAIFTLVNAVVLRPLPYTDPARLVRVTADFTSLNVPDIGMSPPELFDYRDRSSLFEGIAGLFPINANVTAIDEPERVEVLLVSPSYFDVLGTRPQLGRLFGPQDNAPGITEVVVISDALWHRRFGGSPGAIGRKLRIDNDWYTVVGVVPKGFRHPGRSLLTDVEVWAPTSYAGSPFPARPGRGAYFMTGAIARLKPGVSIADVQQRLAAFGAQLRAEFPDDYPARSGWTPALLPLQEDLVGRVKPALLMLFGAVGFVLLIACANIANLLLARASGRQRELAVRRALGSSRGRLLSMLMTESLLLASLGGLAGAGLTVWLVDALVALVPAGLPRASEIVVDTRVFFFTAVIALATAIVFGVLPALQSSRADVHDALKEGSRGSVGGRRVLRSTLIVAEFALALVLLIGAGLLLRSFWRLQQIEIGFEPHDVLSARLWLPQPNIPSTGPYAKHEPRVALYEEIMRRARTLPGVSAVAAAIALPFDGSRGTTTITIEGRESDAISRVPTVQTNIASTGYFELMGIRVLRGRTFSEHDDQHAAPVGIISRAMAERYFAGEDPVGRRLHFGGARSDNPWITIVGVVDDVKYEKIEDQPRPMFYRPLRQASNLSLSLVLKTDADPRQLGLALAREVRAADPDQPTFGVKTMDQIVASAGASRRFATQLLGAFAALALLLAAIGIYGVMAFVVGQRTREIGIRIALGARPRAVVRLVLAQALALALAGVALGGLGAIFLSRLLSGMLFEVRATDPATYAGIALLLTLTSVVAAWLPARRAAAVDPMVALRAE
jgi:putative ABC transport system permease protein